jgi:hypothetical protein
VSCVRTSIRIAKPRREVYEFVATPRLWRRWLIDRVRVAGEEARIHWQVTAREAPQRWAMRARIPQGEVEIDLRLAQNGKGTLCRCEIAYDGVSRLVDLLYVQPRIRREASRSLAALKEALESSGSTRSRAASG